MNVCVPCTNYSHAQASAPTSVHATPQRACVRATSGDQATPRPLAYGVPRAETASARAGVRSHAR